MHTAPTYVGVDISKARLEVACRPSGLLFSEPNDEPGICSLVERLRGMAPTLIRVMSWKRKVVVLETVCRMKLRHPFDHQRTTTYGREHRASDDGNLLLR
jgi:hypothetical protein